MRYHRVSNIDLSSQVHLVDLPTHLEHSHEPIITSVRASLNLNNPDQIEDPIFALLGDQAAAQGAGDVTVSSISLLENEWLLDRVPPTGPRLLAAGCGRSSLHEFQSN